MVHQHFMLADNLTVWENIVLGSEPVNGVRIDAPGAQQHIAELGRRYGLAVDPAALVETLGVGARQRVEILKVLYRGARILILDEPTAVLVPQEVDELFGNLRELKSEGLTIIFISHKLDEVRAISDEITVIRRGTTVGTADPTNVTNRQLAEMMVGSALPVPELRESTVTDTDVLTLETRDGGRAPVIAICCTTSRFTIHAGEVLGIAGVEGNGQAELVDAVMGILPLTSGSIRLGGTDITTAEHAGATRGGGRLHPRGSAPAGAAARGAAVGEPHPRASNPGPVREGRVHQQGGRPRGHPTDRRRLRRAHAGHRRGGGGAVRRQPAEADRRPRDERRSGAADRRAPDPGRRCRRPGGDLGTTARGQGNRTRGAADLRGPGGTDRHVGHPDGDPPRSAGRPIRSPLRHAAVARRGDDRGRSRGPGARRRPGGRDRRGQRRTARRRRRWRWWLGAATILESPAGDAESGGAATRQEI